MHNTHFLADNIIVLDFETTGLSPQMGDRAIEIGAVRIQNGVITERFQELMNPGRRVDSFIEEYTGITNSMLKDAPPCSEVMERFADFMGDSNLLAHNASFDKRFLDAELDRILKSYVGTFACSLLTARRVFQDAPNHKLSTLIDYAHIHSEGTFHRALFDSEMTAKLWIVMLDKIKAEYSLDSIPFQLIQKLEKTPKTSVHKVLSNWKNRQ